VVLTSRTPTISWVGYPIETTVQSGTMPRKYKSILLFLGVFALSGLGVAVAPSAAHASYIFTDNSVGVNVGWFNAPYGNTLPAGALNGTVTGIDMYVGGDSSNYYSATIYDITTSSYVFHVFGCGYGNASTGIFHCDVSSLNATTTSSDSYEVYIEQQSPSAFNNVNLYGGTAPAGVSCTLAGNPGNFCGGGNALYMAVYTSGGGGGVTGDGITSTHIIRTTDPVAYSTTTSPFTAGFDALITDAASSTDGYIFTIYEEGTGRSTSYYGLLPTYSTDVPFHVSTTTIAYSGTGPVTGTFSMVSGMTDYLTRGVPLPIDGSKYFDGFSVPFSVGTTAYSSRNNPPPPAPYAGPEYSSAACALNLNPFASSTFAIGECIGYLVQPASSTMQDFSQLTLANRFPFAYAYGINTMRQALFSASSTATTTLAVTVAGFGTITFLSAAMIAAVPFSSTIKLILSALMWLLTLELLYVTLLRSHNQETGPKV